MLGGADGMSSASAFVDIWVYKDPSSGLIAVYELCRRRDLLFLEIWTADVTGERSGSRWYAYPYPSDHAENTAGRDPQPTW